MTKVKCPGQDTRFWRPGDIFEIKCSRCGRMVEFFKDEASRRCPGCGKRIYNPRLTLGCAQWCPHAKECLGFEPGSAEPQDTVEETLLDKLIDTIGEASPESRDHMAHALKILEHARRIHRDEEGDPRIIMAAALLRGFGVTEPGREDLLTIARRTVREMGIEESVADDICRIAESHDATDCAGAHECMIVLDAEKLAQLEETTASSGTGDKDELLSTFKTETGRELARKLLYGTD